MSQTRTILVDKPLGGWISTPEGGSSGASLEGGENQYANSTNISLFRSSGFYGDIAPGEMFQDMASGGIGTSWMDALPLNGVVDSNGRAWVVLANSTIFFFDISDDIIDGTLNTGTTVDTTNNNDIAIYTATNGSEYVIWTYDSTNASEADIARNIISNTNNATVERTWFSALTGSGKLTKGVPHKIETGPDGIIYITNDRYVSAHDPLGTSGNTQAFDLGPDWQAVCLGKHGNYLAIGARKKSTSLSTVAASETRLYLWDGFTPTADFIYPVDDYNLTSLKSDSGILYIFTQGRNNMTRVKILSGNQILTISESDNIGNAPKAKSVESFKGGVIWGEDSGSFGIDMIHRTGERFGLHQIMHPHLSTASLSAIGMIRNLSSNSLYVGNTVGGQSRIVRINNSSYYPNADFKSRLISLPYESTITKIKFRMGQFGSGASFTIDVFDNDTTLAVGTGAITRQITQAAWGSVDEISIPVFMPNVSAFYFNIRFDHSSSTDTAAIIRSLEFEYMPMSVSKL